MSSRAKGDTVYYQSIRKRETDKVKRKKRKRKKGPEQKWMEQFLNVSEDICMMHVLPSPKKPLIYTAGKLFQPIILLCCCKRTDEVYRRLYHA